MSTVKFRGRVRKVETHGRSMDKLRIARYGSFNELYVETPRNVFFVEDEVIVEQEAKTGKVISIKSVLPGKKKFYDL